MQDRRTACCDGSSMLPFASIVFDKSRMAKTAWWININHIALLPHIAGNYPSFLWWQGRGGLAFESMQQPAAWLNIQVYLRAQIARITADTIICPKGFLKKEPICAFCAIWILFCYMLTSPIVQNIRKQLQEDEESPIEQNEEFVCPPSSELQKKEALAIEIKGKAGANGQSHTGKCNQMHTLLSLLFNAFHLLRSSKTIDLFRAFNNPFACYVTSTPMFSERFVLFFFFLRGMDAHAVRALFMTESKTQKR